jgi:hypothetical protein
LADLTLKEMTAMVARDLDDRRFRRTSAEDVQSVLREGHRHVWRTVVESGERYGAVEEDATWPADTRHVQLDTLLAAGTQSVALVHSVADVTGNTSGSGWQLEKASYADQFGTDSSDRRTDFRIRGRGAPLSYFTYGSPLRLGVFPIQSSTLTLRVLWLPSLTPMVDQDDTPQGVPRDAQEGIVVYAVNVIRGIIEGAPSQADELRLARIGSTVEPFIDNRARQSSRRVRMADKASVLRHGRGA